MRDCSWVGVGTRASEAGRAVRPLCVCNGKNIGRVAGT